MATHLDAVHSRNLLTRADIDPNKRRKHLKNLTTLRVLPFACGVSLAIMIRPLTRTCAAVHGSVKRGLRRRGSHAERIPGC